MYCNVYIITWWLCFAIGNVSLPGAGAIQFCFRSAIILIGLCLVGSVSKMDFKICQRVTSWQDSCSVPDVILLPGAAVPNKSVLPFPLPVVWSILLPPPSVISTSTPSQLCDQYFYPGPPPSCVINTTTSSQLCDKYYYLHPVEWSILLRNAESRFKSMSLKIRADFVF